MPYKMILTYGLSIIAASLLLRLLADAAPGEVAVSLIILFALSALVVSVRVFIKAMRCAGQSVQSIARLLLVGMNAIAGGIAMSQPPLRPPSHWFNIEGFMIGVILFGVTTLIATAATEMVRRRHQ